jgi:hypothetical protein
VLRMQAAVVAHLEYQIIRGENACG